MSLAERPDFYRQLIENLYDGVYLLDHDRRITYWNLGAERMTGYASQDVLGKCCADNILMHTTGDGTQICKESCPAAQTLIDGESREAQVFLHHRDGHRVPVDVRVAPIRDEAGNIEGVVEIFSDNAANTAMVDRLQRLEKLAFLDPLTGAGNRRYAEATLRTRVAEMHRYGWKFGILFADIDYFKQFNDTHGHDVGDQVLKMVANTLIRSVRAFDAVARWGGEEFVCILAHINEDECFQKAERLRGLVEQSSLPVGDQMLGATISIGATLAHGDDDEASVIKRADEYMYRSKCEGRNRVTTDATR